MKSTSLAMPDDGEPTPDQLNALRWHEECLERARENSDPRCIENQDPERAAKALAMLAAGTPLIQIHRALKMDRSAIRSLRWRHKETLETRRKEFAKKFAMGAEALVDLTFKKIEQIEDDDDMLAATSMKDLALGAAIFTDKAMALSGMASTVIEHRRGPSIEDAQKAIAEARARIANRATEEAIEAEVIG